MATTPISQPAAGPLETAIREKVYRPDLLSAPVLKAHMDSS
jgi:hypothetical protein